MSLGAIEELTAIMEVHSLYEDGFAEALRYKWIISEKHNRDMGDAALHDWARHHWPAHVRAKWFEHIHGIKCWKELDRRKFGLLKRMPTEHPVLLDRILDRLKAGQENLDVINWALDWHLPMDMVVEILEVLDINSLRIAIRFSK